jgi:DNA (cytosine-5)-methyltransferase 1
VEIDKFCQKVLQKNFPGVPIHDDIKTFKYTGTTPFILTGGFPCQPFSCAGKRRGKEDNRFLWPEMVRVISESKPCWVIGENVAGFINMGLDDCISDLEAQGYEVQAFIIPACAVNAPHRRDRVWIVAHLQRGKSGEQTEQERRQNISGAGCHAQDTRRSGFNSGSSSMPGHKGGEPFACDTDRFNGNDAGHGASEISQFKEAEIRGLQINPNPNNSQTSRQRGNSGGVLSKSESTRLDGNPWQEPWIEAATRLCGVDARVSHRVDRLKSLGNAIVPQVAYQIIKGIVETNHKGD